MKTTKLITLKKINNHYTYASPMTRQQFVWLKSISSAITVEYSTTPEFHVVITYHTTLSITIHHNSTTSTGLKQTTCYNGKSIYLPLCQPHALSQNHTQHSSFSVLTNLGQQDLEVLHVARICLISLLSK